MSETIEVKKVEIQDNKQVKPRVFKKVDVNMCPSDPAELHLCDSCA